MPEWSCRAGSTTEETVTGAGGPGGGEQNTGEMLIISGGTNTITADGDGLDSNGYLQVSGGTTVVNGPTNDGNAALDASEVTVTGGSLIAAGSSGMAQAPGTDGQAWVSAATAVSAGQKVEIRSGDTVVATYTAVRDASSVIVSDAGITNGSSYDVVVDGTTATAVTAGEHTGGMGGMGGGPRL